MFERVIDDLTESTGRAIRLTSLVAATAVGLFITTCFLCAAAFICVLDRYGLVPACLTGAAVFFIVTLIAAISYMMRKRGIKKKVAQTARSAPQPAFDPVLVATGLQIVRAIGFKRLLPILAVGGIALGIMASRQAASDEAPPAE